MNEHHFGRLNCGRFGFIPRFMTLPPMTTKKPPKTPVFPALAALIERHQLTDTQAASLLGVPVFTLRKWTNGTRSPGAAAVRLVEVLGILDALAPDLLGHLMPSNGGAK